MSSRTETSGPSCHVSSKGNVLTPRTKTFVALKTEAILANFDGISIVGNAHLTDCELAHLCVSIRSAFYPFISVHLRDATDFNLRDDTSKGVTTLVIQMSRETRWSTSSKSKEACTHSAHLHRSELSPGALATHGTSTTDSDGSGTPPPPRRHSGARDLSYSHRRGRIHCLHQQTSPPSNHPFLSILFTTQKTSTWHGFFFK